MVHSNDDTLLLVLQIQPLEDFYNWRYSEKLRQFHRETPVSESIF